MRPHTLKTYKKFLPDESSMLAMGGIIARALPDDKVLIFLQGELGAGKTTLVRGFMRALGFAGRVKSPTYTLVEPYQISAQMVYHFDFYRIHEPAELDFIGLGDYLNESAYCLIEWPELAGERLPPADLVLKLAVQDDGRNLIIQASGNRGQEIMEQLRHELKAV